MTDFVRTSKLRPPIFSYEISKFVEATSKEHPETAITWNQC